jgi:CBS domain-containing protein
MLLRKRAWDVMRSDIYTVPETATLGLVIGRHREAIKEHPDNQVVLVVNDHGHLKGAVSLMDVMGAIEEQVLRDDLVKNAEDADWDKAFSRACVLGCSMDISKLVRKEVPTLRAGDPVLLVLDLLVDKRTQWAVVVEGEKPIGVISMGEIFREISREMLEGLG